VIPDAAPALVSVEVWEAVQQKLKDNKRQSKRNQCHGDQYLLRGGFAVCGYCGRVMTAISQMVKGKPDARKFVYRCNGAVVLPGMSVCEGGYFGIAPSVVDTAVWETLSYLFEDPKRIHNLRDYQASKVGKKGDWTLEQIRATKGLLDKVNRQKENAARAVLNAASNEAFAMWNAKVEQLAAEECGLMDELEQLHRSHGKQKLATARIHSIEEWIGAIGSSLQETTYDERRQLLRAIDLKVTVYRKDHEPRYVIRFDLAAMSEQYPDLPALDLPTITDSDVESLRAIRSGATPEENSIWPRAIMSLSTPFCPNGLSLF
jgi:hypothetical protein